MVFPFLLHTTSNRAKKAAFGIISNATSHRCTGALCDCRPYWPKSDSKSPYLENERFGRGSSVERLRYSGDIVHCPSNPTLRTHLHRPVAGSANSTRIPPTLRGLCLSLSITHQYSARFVSRLPFVLIIME
jgi:hypothetical protein